MQFNKPRPKKLFFQGNSLLDTSLNHTISNQKYVTYTLYNNIRSSYPGLTLVDYSISGQDEDQINALIATQFRKGLVLAQDVIVIWEGTNDLAHNPAKSGATAFANLQTFVNAIALLTNKYIVCTSIARDLAADPVDLMTRIDDYNTLIRANYSGTHLCDLAANSHFDSRADASDTTYYDTDKLHLVQAGQDLIISLLTTAITAVL